MPKYYLGWNSPIDNRPTGFSSNVTPTLPSFDWLEFPDQLDITLENPGIERKAVFEAATLPDAWALVEASFPGPVTRRHGAEATPERMVMYASAQGANGATMRQGANYVP